MLSRSEAGKAAAGHRGRQREILELSRRDPVYWINNWCWTYDPRREDAKVLPFSLFPRQQDYILWRRDRYASREHGVIEKSRDMGVTWLNAADQLHHWLFTPGFKGTFGSRKEALVDKKGDPDSIFSKLRFLLAYLPKWMRPEGFKASEHDNLLRLVNPANGSVITGEGGDNMGRGGRSSLYDLDEFAFVEHALAVDGAVSQNSDCILYTSTANGQGNVFYAKRMGGKLPVFTFHWRQDPRKDDAWYQRQVDTLDPVTVAQEIDIDYAAAVDSVIIPRAWVDAAASRPQYANELGAICIGGDLAEGGTDKCVAVVREGRNILHIEAWHDPEAKDSPAHFIALGLEYEKRLEPHHKLYFFLDTLGVGAGHAGTLRNYVKEHKKRQWVVVGVKVSQESPDPKCYRLRDALWWRMREWFKTKEPSAKGLPPALWNTLATEASTPTYRLHPSNGLIQAESKEDLKKRGVKSPDHADALMHTFAWEAMKRAEDETPDWLKGMRGRTTGMVG